LKRLSCFLIGLLVFWEFALFGLTKQELKREAKVRKELLELLDVWVNYYDPYSEIVKLVRKLAENKRLHMGIKDWENLVVCFKANYLRECRINLIPLLWLEYLVVDKQYSLEVKLIEGFDKFEKDKELVPLEIKEIFYDKMFKSKPPWPSLAEEVTAHIVGEAIDIYRIEGKKINWDRESKKLIRKLVRDLYKGHKELASRFRKRWPKEIEKNFSRLEIRDEDINYLLLPWVIIVSSQSEVKPLKNIQEGFFSDVLGSGFGPIDVYSSQQIREKVKKLLGISYKDPMEDHVHLETWPCGLLSPFLLIHYRTPH